MFAQARTLILSPEDDIRELGIILDRDCSIPLLLKSCRKLQAVFFTICSTDVLSVIEMRSSPTVIAFRYIVLLCDYLI